MNASKVAALNGGRNLPAEGIGAILVNVSGTGTLHPFNPADTFRADITAGAVVDTVTALPGVAVTTGGLVTLSNFAFVNTTGADPISEAVYFFTDTGNPATDRLLTYYDTATGLPLTPNGNNIDVDCSNGILQL